MSVSANCIESIDLREGKYWKTAENNLCKLFNSNLAAVAVTQSRLVGN